jgi:hypothetical protein
VKSIVTSYIRIAKIRSKLDHIISIVTTIATHDNIVAITRTKINLSINNCTIINKGIIKATIDFVYNR